MDSKQYFLSFNDFSSEYDTITLGRSTQEKSPQHRFLEILSKDTIIDEKSYVLDGKIKFVFPMFYRFDISQDKENVVLYREKNEAYEWLIDKSIKEDVNKHSAYGLGIAKKYCESNIGPSYIEISQETSSSMKVEIHYYRDAVTTSARLKLQEKCINSSRKIEFFKDEKYDGELIKLEKINVVYSDGNKSLPKLFNEKSFVDGLKSHWPIVGGDENKEKRLYYFFTNNIKFQNEKSQGIGGVFVITESELDEGEKGFFILSGYTLANKVALNQIRVKAMKEAIKSAKAAIMSRNMSHNLGSHVMSYLKHQMGSTAAIWKADACILRNLIEGGKFNRKVNLAELDKVQMPYLLGLGHFIGYLQERQDYIATIATDYVPYGAPVNMKDAIYDELNPDLRYKRHNPGESKNCSANILLNFLVKSEGFSRENLNTEEDKDDIRTITNKDILFGFPYYDGNGRNTEFWGLNKRQDDKSENPALTELRKLNFSIPGGLVGRQAVFSIMENIIRNAAKHGNTKGISNLELTFDVIDLGDIDNCPEISKRIMDSKWLELYKNSSDKDYLYLLTVTDNLDYKNQDSKLLPTLRTGLVEDYIDQSENMVMINTNKGIKEMRISAAWMRREPDEEKYFRYDDWSLLQTSSIKKKAPLVAVELTSANHLRYMFCLQQERFAAIILDGFDNEEKQVFMFFNQLNKKDWALFDDVAQVKEKMKTSFRFIVVANKDRYNELRPYSSNRLMVLNTAEIDESFKTVRHIKNELYEQTQDKITKNILEKKIYEQGEIVKDKIQQAFYGINNASELIYIWDDESVKAHMSKVEDERIRLCSTDEDVTTAQYAYRYHHSSKIQFDNFMNPETLDFYKNLRFVEAISGDNSTDRLIRREPLNKRWYYSHLYAMKKKVAIIDERIFKTIHDIDEKLFTVSRKEVDEIKSQIKELSSCLQQEKKERIEETISKMKDANIVFSDADMDDIIFYETNDKIDLIWILLEEKLNSVITKVRSDNYKSILYQQKGVDIFTVVSNGQGFEIVGCINHDPVKLPVTFDTIASIKYDKINDTCNIQFNAEYGDYFKKHYDYISIHQGILDKIYEGFGIKEHTEAYVESKKVVTDELFNKLSCYSSDTKISEYLPCFFIHSGRAKPSSEDMPQKQPFVQYAALEHSVLDCKFALVELLDYAKYES